VEVGQLQLALFQALTRWAVGGGRLLGLGVHVGEWSALPCGSPPPPLQREVTICVGIK
jgi:hypothetical protein